MDYKVIGIDISKAKFDVVFRQPHGRFSHFTFTNDLRGFKAFTKHVGSNDHCVMEASGPYYLQLATFLHLNDLKVSVVNPLSIKRFAQMKLIRAKTDKKDAGIIAEYGIKEQPATWVPNDTVVLKMQQINTLIESILKQKTALHNQLEAFKSSGAVDKQAGKSLNILLKTLDRERERLESTLNQLVTAHYKETYQLLTSIPGIGKKAATMVIVITNNFKKFSNHKQLIAYIGFIPRIYQSGSSVKGKGHICKMGKAQARKILYLCTWTAKRCNASCKAMYDRLKQKGKPERVIKIALANKLLKQMFAVATKRQEYVQNYLSKPCF